MYKQREEEEVKKAGKKAALVQIVCSTGQLSV
jgi:hypothetical protein